MCAQSNINNKSTYMAIEKVTKRMKKSEEKENTSANVEKRNENVGNDNDIHQTATIPYDFLFSLNMETF